MTFRTRLVLTTSLLFGFFAAVPFAAAQLLPDGERGTHFYVAPVTAADRAQVRSHEVPARPAQFCTQMEKSEYLHLLGRYERIALRELDEIDLVNRGIARDLTGGRDMSPAERRRYEADSERNARAADLLRRYIARLRGLIADTLPRPIDDCGQDWPAAAERIGDDGSISYGRGLSIDPKPARFCSQDEKAKAIETVRQAIANGETTIARNLDVKAALIVKIAASSREDEMASIQGYQSEIDHINNLNLTYAGLLKGLRQRLGELEAMPVEDCAPKAEEKEPEKKVGFDFRFGQSEAALAVAYRDQELPALAFLGREPPGATAPTLGLFNAGARHQSALVEAELSIPIIESADGGRRVVLRASSFDGSSRAEFGRTDLAGDRLVIPGLGVGPNGNGYVLNYAGGLNSPDEGWAERESVSRAAELGLRFSFPAGGDALGFIEANAGYRTGESEAQFFAAIPGFARDVQVVQSIETTAFTLGARGGFRFDLGERWSAGIEAAGTVIFASHDGENRLSFTGFDDQLVTGDVSNTGFHGMAEVSLGYDVSPDAQLALFVRGEHETGVPVWETPGGGALTRIGSDGVQGFSAGLRVSVAL